MGRRSLKRDQNFRLQLSKEEKLLLQEIARHEHIPMAAVLRRLIWREAERLGLREPILRVRDS